MKDWSSERDDMCNGVGVTTEQALLSPENTIHPDMYTDQLSDLLEAAKSAAPVAA